VADCLELDWKRLNTRVDKVIGNLPYNIASPLLWSMLPCLDRVQRLVFTVQKEVARRIVSSPGSKAYGGLSVWLQSFAEIRYEFEIGPSVFRPRPRVDSAVVSMRPFSTACRVQDGRSLSDLIHRCFQQRRKQLKNILKPVWTDELERWLAKEGLSPQARPEAMSPEQFVRMSPLVEAGKLGENSD
jgi:16S rRNA (adenine1518-N6/adenine1519-N6)-dimethyltransferase